LEEIKNQIFYLDFLAFSFVHPAQALLNSTPQLLARDLQPHAHLRAPRRADRAAQDSQLSLNSAALDRRGAVAIYLRPEKAGLNFLFIF
jgi:hypothetical protein